MALDKAMKNLKFDVRLTEFNLNNNVLTKEELEQHLAKIPDSGTNAEGLNIDNRNSSKEDSSDESRH